MDEILEDKEESYANEIVVNVIFNDKPPTKYDYKYFTAELANGEAVMFHYHKNNPIPTREEVIGLTWNELVEVCRQKWYEAIRG